MLSKMSDFGKPQPCRNQCGAYIYFDKDSEVGHPSTDKWLPLEYNHDSGIKTGLVHQCPKKPSAHKFTQNVNMPTSSTQTTKQHEQASSFHVSDESVDRGINAFSMMTSLMKEVEEVKAEIKHVREVLGNQERLFSEMLVWVQQQMKKQ